MKAAAEATECRRQARGCAKHQRHRGTPARKEEGETREGGGSPSDTGCPTGTSVNPNFTVYINLSFLQSRTAPELNEGQSPRNDYKFWASTAVPPSSRPPLPKYPIRMEHHSIPGVTDALTSTVNFPLSSSERRGSSWGWSLTIPSFRRVSCQKQKTEQVRPGGTATAAHRQLGREFLPPPRTMRTPLSRTDSCSGWNNTHDLK